MGTFSRLVLGVRLNDRSASRTRTSLENVPIPFSDVYGTVRSHATAHRAGRVGHPLCGPSGRDASALSATLSTTLRLDHVNPDEDDLRSATVLRPMVDVARLRDEATRSERLGVAALPELGEMATQNIGERRTLLMAMKPRHPPGLEGDRPQAKLVAGEIRAEIDRALDPGVESLVLGGRTLLSQGRTQPKTASERASADAVDRKRAGHARHARIGLELPEKRPGLGVEGPEVPVVRSAEEDEAAPGREHRTPVHVSECVGPDPLTAAHVPGLELADVRRALTHAHGGLGPVDAEIQLAGLVPLPFAYERAAQIFVGGDVEGARLWVVGRGWPVLPAPETGTEGRRPAVLWLPLGAVARPARLRIDARENLPPDGGLGGDEPDAGRSGPEDTQVPVPPGMDQAPDRPSVAPDVDQEWRRDF